MLRKKGVVGKFVEFYGPGLDGLSLADRATIANMAPGIWRDLRLLPDRRRNRRLISTRPPASPPASRWSKNMPSAQGLFRTRADARTGVHRYDLTRTRHGRPVARRSEASGRPRCARRHRPGLQRRIGDRIQENRRPRQPLQGRGRRLRPRPRRRGDRRHHLLHQHLEPERHDRRGPAGAKRRRQGVESRALGQDLAGARLARSSPNIWSRPACRNRSTSSASISSASAAPPASAIPARCPKKSPSRSTPMASSRRPCFRATAISRAASRPMCRPIISPRRRWSSPMRWPVRCRRISPKSRSATARRASRSI